MMNSHLLFTHSQMRVAIFFFFNTYIQFRFHSNPFFKLTAYTEGMHWLFLLKCETLYFSLLNWIIFILHPFSCLSIFVLKLVYTSLIFKTKKPQALTFFPLSFLNRMYPFRSKSKLDFNYLLRFHVNSSYINFVTLTPCLPLCPSFTFFSNYRLAGGICCLQEDSPSNHDLCVQQHRWVRRLKLPIYWQSSLLGANVLLASVDNNQYLSMVYPLLVKLLQRILHIPTFPWHFYLHSPPALGIFLWLFFLTWTESISQCCLLWSHPTPFPQDLSNMSCVWSLHIRGVSYSAQITWNPF